jgi:hypothetical protein
MPPVPRRHEVDRDGRSNVDSRFQETDSMSSYLADEVGIGGINLEDRDTGPPTF